MAIAKDLRDLPAGSASEGEAPSDIARALTKPILDAWYEMYQEKEGEFGLEWAVEGTRFRASWAAGCARELSYKVRHNDARLSLKAVEATLDLVEKERHNEVLGQAQRAVQAEEPTDPMSIANAWIFEIGHWAHESIQKAVEKAYPGAQIEIQVDMRPDIDGCATIDCLITIPSKFPDDEGRDHQRIVMEIKTIGGFGFKMAAIPFKGAPSGPRHSAKVQGALQATAVDADLLVVAYFAMENLSPSVAAKAGVDEAGRFHAAWSYTPDEFKAIAAREHKRVARILEIVDAGKLAPRAIDDPELPAGARVTDPVKEIDKGMWTVVVDGEITNTGLTWHCGYCGYRQRCVADGPGTPQAVTLRLV